MYINLQANVNTRAKVWLVTHLVSDIQIASISLVSHQDAVGSMQMYHD